MNLAQNKEIPVNEDIDKWVNILYKNGGLLIFLCFFGAILYLFTDYFSDIEDEIPPPERNHLLTNLKTKKDWKQILEITNSSSDLLSLSFRAEAFHKSNELKKSWSLMKHIISQKSKSTFDSYSIGKVHHLLKDEENAFHWFLKSLEEDKAKENPMVVYTVASYYQRGLYVKKDLGKARECLEKSVLMKDPISEYLLGINLTKEDPKRSLELLELSAEKNNIQALLNLGDFYISKDSTKATKYFEKLSELRSSIGMRKYAFMMMKGLGIDKNESRAFELMEMSFEIDKQDVETLLFLVSFLKEGKGIQKDEIKAFELLSSCDQKNGEIYYQLALMFLEGKGVEKNEKKYFENLKLATQEMHPPALYLMGVNLIKSSKNETTASIGMDYLTESSKLGHKEASKFLVSVSSKIQKDLKIKI
jgi:TPR repeat protein